jgi:hypothetical protein
MVATTPDEVRARLDELGIRTVILDSHIPAKEPFPHYVLLGQALGSSSAWRQCGEEGRLQAYCRAEPLPRGGRVTLTLRDLGRSITEE